MMNLESPVLAVEEGFFINPDLILDEMKLEQPRSANKNGYECVRYRIDNIDTSPIAKQIARKIGIPTKCFIACELVGYLKKHELRNKERGNWIHSDRCGYIAMIFLNEATEQRSGISFYKHISTGISDWRQIVQMAENAAVATKSLAVESSIVENWEEVYSIENRFNRLVIFDPRHFHQATSYFGASSSECRVTFNFYFRENETMEKHEGSQADSANLITDDLAQTQYAYSGGIEVQKNSGKSRAATFAAELKEISGLVEELYPEANQDNKLRATVDLMVRRN